MKILKIIILILIGFFLGVSANLLLASKITSIQVPEYINGYKTLDLLDYLASLKAKQDDADRLLKIPTQPKETAPKINNHTIPGTVSASIILDYEK